MIIQLRRLDKVRAICSLMVMLSALPCLADNIPKSVPVSLTNTITPSAIHDAASDDLLSRAEA